MVGLNEPDEERFEEGGPLCDEAVVGDAKCGLVGQPFDDSVVEERAHEQEPDRVGVEALGELGRVARLGEKVANLIGDAGEGEFEVAIFEVREPFVEFGTFAEADECDFACMFRLGERVVADRLQEAPHFARIGSRPFPRGVMSSGSFIELVFKNGPDKVILGREVPMDATRPDAEADGLLDPSNGLRFDSVCL